MSKRLRTIYYLIVDFLTAAAAWSIFNFYRKTQIDTLKTGIEPDSIFDNQFFISVLVLPTIWVLVYYLSGSYNNVLRKSRINELMQTLATSLIGVTFIFFFILLDDFDTCAQNLFFPLLTEFILWQQNG